MSTFFLSISGGTDVLLVDSGGTYLAYQAGSDEGGGGEVSYTFTPTFDTALIPLPSEVEVWYSTDNVNFYSTGNITGATRNGNVLSATLTGSGTIYAALVYVEDGSRVTDETDSAIASVSAAYSGSVPTTIGTVTLNSPADITVGDPAVSYTATISGDAADETYAWDVSPGTAGVDYTIIAGVPQTANATINFLTANTYTVTCTVSSVTASDSPAVGTNEIVVGAAPTGATMIGEFTATMEINGSTWTVTSSSSSGVVQGFRENTTGTNMINFSSFGWRWSPNEENAAYTGTYPSYGAGASGVAQTWIDALGNNGHYIQFSQTPSGGANTALATYPTDAFSIAIQTNYLAVTSSAMGNPTVETGDQLIIRVYDGDPNA